MRIKFILTLTLFSIFLGYSQKRYTFLTEMSDISSAPKFERQDGLLVYKGNNAVEKSFFSKYTIFEFYQSFPDSKVQRTLNVFTIVGNEKSLMDDLKSKFPQKYLGSEDLSDLKLKLANSYPNDYGSTSPVANLGLPESLSNFDYINVPKAWDYTYGDAKVKIGISDSAIDIDDIDFRYKTTLLSIYNNPYSPPYSMANSSWHGTSTAAIAAAQGNNGHGTVGICSNCSIVFTNYLFGDPGPEQDPTPEFNYLLQLAIAGAKVINMSWGFSSTNISAFNYYQWVIDEIYDMNVVLVASAMNDTSFNALYAPNNYMYYAFPASLKHVISVSSVNHKNEFGQQVETLPDWGAVSRYVKDMVSTSVVTNYMGNGPYAFVGATHRTNDMVDICAPGFSILQYPWYVLGNIKDGEPLYYGDGTSSAAPHVAGTVGLMYSLNSCLVNDEVEDILQLTSKNLEHIPGNEPFIGRSGSGKLETGDAVEFVSNMKSATGSALIDGQDFYRFDFKLSHINNKLTITNQIFRNICTADFTAKKEINILNSDFNPTSGFTDLKINSALTVCTTSNKNDYDKTESEDNQQYSISSKLYPNPNTGTFTISVENVNVKNMTVNVVNVLGKIVYKTIVTQSVFDINLSNLPSGIYFVKLNEGDYSETLKFIKN